MNFKRGFLRIFFGLMFLCFFVTAVPAAEILTEDDFIKKVVVEEDFIKTADNFLILFDTSSSMAEFVVGCRWHGNGGTYAPNELAVFDR